MEVSFNIVSRMSGLESQNSEEMTSKEDLESVKITALLGGRGREFSSWSAFSIAQSSAERIEQGDSLKGELFI